MPSAAERSRIRVDELASQVRHQMIPLSQSFSYFSVTPLGAEEIKQYVEEPLAALPPALTALIPKVEILLTPYLEKRNGRGGGDFAGSERPSNTRQIPCSRVVTGQGVTLAFAIKDEDLADYHYSFYNGLAAMVASAGGEPLKEFTEHVREELRADVHGEVDDKSWRLKQALLRRPSVVTKESKAFQDYVRQAFEDTLTLYLHGICCDIDVEPGPRQMPSRSIRRRLELLLRHFPPPTGYAVLPEQVRRR
ncbi:MAG: hypothetical protein ACKV22_02755 [Bryobacteraceae bacterium]